MLLCFSFNFSKKYVQVIIFSYNLLQLSFGTICDKYHLTLLPAQITPPQQQKPRQHQKKFRSTNSSRTLTSAGKRATTLALPPRGPAITRRASSGEGSRGRPRHAKSVCGITALFRMKLMQISAGGTRPSSNRRCATGKTSRA